MAYERWILSGREADMLRCLLHGLKTGHQYCPKPGEPEHARRMLDAFTTASEREGPDYREAPLYPPSPFQEG